MSRFADGDRAAFRVIFDGLWPAIVELTTRLVGDNAEAEDAAQRALIKVFHRISQLDPTRDGVAWALTIAAYEALTVRNHRARRRERGADLDPEVIVDDAGSPRDHVIASQLRSAMHAVLGELAARDQEALQAMLDGDGSPGETQRKRRFRALTRLRAAWRRTHG